MPDELGGGGTECKHFNRDSDASVEGSSYFNPPQKPNFSVKLESFRSASQKHSKGGQTAFTVKSIKHGNKHNARRSGSALSQCWFDHDSGLL